MESLVSKSPKLPSLSTCAGARRRSREIPLPKQIRPPNIPKSQRIQYPKTLMGWKIDLNRTQAKNRVTGRGGFRLEFPFPQKCGEAGAHCRSDAAGVPPPPPLPPTPAPELPGPRAGWEKPSWI